MRGLAIIYRPHMLWAFGGSERRFVNLSKYLERDYGISFDSIEPYPPLKLSMQTYHDPYIVKLSDNQYMNLFEWLSRGTARILTLRKKQYDFVYATNNNLYNVFLGIVASKLLSLPLIVVVHHLKWVNYFDPEEPLSFKFKETYEFFRKESLNSLGSSARTWIAYTENVFLNMADALITVSKAVASQLRQLGYNKRIFVEGNGINERHHKQY